MWWSCRCQSYRRAEGTIRWQEQLTLLPCCHCQRAAPTWLRYAPSVKEEKELSALKFESSPPLVRPSLVCFLLYYAPFWHGHSNPVPYAQAVSFFLQIRCSVLNWVATVAFWAKFVLANTLLITSPTQMFLFSHSQLTSKQQDEWEVSSTVCNTTRQLFRAEDFCFLSVPHCLSSSPEIVL